MATTPVCTVDAAGIHVPTYADCLAYVQGKFRDIYGQDIYLEADSQDGQLCAIFALALTDTNNEAASVYNAFSPSTAQGAGLSSVVKINGIRRKVPTSSSVDVTIIGVVGTIITNGAVSDGANAWYLPAVVTIPATGQIIVTATSAAAGAIEIDRLAIDTANGAGNIITPTYGWQAAANLTASIPGAAVETDAQLRIRQSKSTMIAAQGVDEALVGAVLALPGVTDVRLYENDTAALDGNGVPGHCISLVVTGGDDAAIASVIARLKGQGIGTYGTTIVPVTNSVGITRKIGFFRPMPVSIAYTITVKTGTGYTIDVANALKATLAAWTSGLGVGADLQVSRAYGVAYSVPGNGAYEIMSPILVGRQGQPQAPGDVAIAFNEIASCDPTLINLVVANP